MENAGNDETTTRECEREQSGRQQPVKSTGADMAVLQLISTRTESITVLKTQAEPLALAYSCISH